MRLARDLGMEPVAEICSKQELDLAMQAQTEIVGINNRDLRTLQIDSHRKELAPLIPEGVVVISEGGINTYEDAKRMLKAGADATLVGTAIMCPSNVKEAVQRVMGIGKS